MLTGHASVPFEAHTKSNDQIQMDTKWPLLLYFHTQKLELMLMDTKCSNGASTGELHLSCILHCTAAILKHRSINVL